jgi:hypothetical protein
MVVTAAFRPPHPSPQPGTASKGWPLNREGITRSSFIDPAIARKHSHRRICEGVGYRLSKSATESAAKANKRGTTYGCRTYLLSVSD